MPLWHTVLAKGPKVERFGADSDRVIAFGTDEGFTEEEYAALRDSLTKGDTHTLPFRLEASHSDCREGAGWEDFFGESCTIELCADAYSRLKAEVTFDDPTGWVAFAKELLLKQLASPESVKHHEYRLWQFLAWASPRLHDSVATALRRPLEELLHVELNTSMSAVGNYYAVIPNRIQQRKFGCTCR